MLAKRIMENEFKSLVENALDFLERSIKDQETGDAKYSVINFFTGLELCLKARLLKEHWALCASDVGNVGRAQFTAGNFISVGMDDAVKRLERIVGSKIKADEIRVYQKLRERRNQAVHFFHPADLSAGKRVAVEQLCGWHFLYRRLTSAWEECFAPYLDRLETIHLKFSRRTDYFPAIYAELKDEILKQTKNRIWTECDFCKQPSAFTKGEKVKGVHQLECAVCGTEAFRLFLPCRKCGKPALRSFEKSTTCQWCDQSHEASVEEEFEQAANDLFPESLPTAWCGECGYTVEPSVFEVGGSALCLACNWFDVRSDISYCAWCGDTVTGNVGTDREPGCIRCQFYIEYGEQELDAPEYLIDPAKRSPSGPI